MSRVKDIYALLIVWRGGKTEILSCYAKKTDAYKKCMEINKRLRISQAIIVKVLFVESLL